MTDPALINSSVKTLFASLPKEIQAFVQSPERDATSLRISQMYNLHADQAGVFERAYIYMLLGVYTPQEFTQELRNADFSEDTIRGLASEVNEQVFKKIKAAEQESASISPAYRTPAPPPAVPVMSVAQPVMPPAPATPVAPHARTMQEDMEIVQHPERVGSHVMVQTQVSAPVPHIPMHSEGPVMPARSFQTASVPHTAMPVAPVPTYPRTPLPSAQPIAQYQLPVQPVQPIQPESPIKKEGAADPYREQV